MDEADRLKLRKSTHSAHLSSLVCWFPLLNFFLIDSNIKYLFSFNVQSDFFLGFEQRMEKLCVNFEKNLI